MTDILGKNPIEYYSKEEARRYNLSGAFRRIQESMTRDALSVAEFEPKSSVLDIGCGTGFSTKVIKGMGFDVVGCDINDNMLFFARKKGLNVVKCDMRSMPFKDSEFDYGISISAIQWLKPTDYSRVLSEIRRVIRLKSAVQFYPKTSEELRFFIGEARKIFEVEEIEVGEGRKKKTYIILKKRRKLI